MTKQVCERKCEVRSRGKGVLEGVGLSEGDESSIRVCGWI